MKKSLNIDIKQLVVPARRYIHDIGIPLLVWRTANTVAIILFFVFLWLGYRALYSVTADEFSYEPTQNATTSQTINRTELREVLDIYTEKEATHDLLKTTRPAYEFPQ